MPEKKSKKQTDESQVDKFRAKARELECDESEKAFDEKLKKVTNYKPKEPSGEEPN